jgi:hypothetical protein
MENMYVVVVSRQEPEITSHCFGDCGRGILMVMSDPDLGAIEPCRQEECPHLDKQTAVPLWNDINGRDVYLRRLVPLPQTA